MYYSISIEEEEEEEIEEEEGTGILKTNLLLFLNTTAIIIIYTWKVVRKVSTCSFEDIVPAFPAPYTVDLYVWPIINYNRERERRTIIIIYVLYI